MNHSILISPAPENLEKPNIALLQEIPAENVWLANFPSKNTRSAYKRSVADMVTYLNIECSEDLYNVDMAHLIAWRESMTEHGLKPRAIAAKLSAVSSLFQHLIEQGMATKNPTLGVKRPKISASQVETVAITPRQVRAMLDAPDTSTLIGLRDNAILHTYFYTGCRVSEPTKLKVSDFFEDQGYFCLQFIVKGGKVNRVAIHQELQIAIRRYLAAVDHDTDQNEYLFKPVTRSKPYVPMSRKEFGRIFTRYRNAAGIGSKVTPHSARATFITEALEKNHPLEDVQRTVAHSCTTTTLSYDKRANNPRKSASFVVNY